MELNWLPQDEGWSARLAGAAGLPTAEGRWARLVACGNARIDFIQTGKLDRVAQRLFPAAAPAITKPVRLALLGSSTLKHLVPGIRVGGLRRGMEIEVLEGEYGQYRQELLDTASPLHAWKPDAILLALDSYHLAGGQGATADAALANMQHCWAMAQAMGATVIQQTALPVFSRLLGNNEQRLPDSSAAVIEAINARLRPLADAAGVHLLAADAYAAEQGTREWHDPALWHRSKQEVHPRVSHFYGDLVGRMLAALRGRSAKCLVLDLDNTVWGGVIGDDGLEGIHLGQGSATGEAFVAFQQYALRLAARGVILAVCSKNDEANALAPFAEHPEMVLKRNDIACFMANWGDKATNLRQIAKELNIGLDSLVFADDNPFERNLVRQELPEVQVPELPEDPSLYPATIAEAGYFEALSITAEDRERTGQYRANAERESLRETTTDLQGYLRGLEMELVARPFDQLGLPRIVQLINKTNQFNLTTQRYTEAEVRAMMDDPAVLTYQLRLLDRFGDNGMIAILIGRLAEQHGAALPPVQTGRSVTETEPGAKRFLYIDTWLMSCRVLGRQVEEACLNLLAAAARDAGAVSIVGTYRPTAKNGMVRELYPRLGFTLENDGTEVGAVAGETRWTLPLESFQPRPVILRVTDDFDASARGATEATERRDGRSRDLQQTH